MEILGHQQHRALGARPLYQVNDLLDDAVMDVAGTQRGGASTVAGQQGADQREHEDRARTALLRFFRRLHDRTRRNRRDLLRAFLLGRRLDLGRRPHQLAVLEHERAAYHRIVEIEPGVEVVTDRRRVARQALVVGRERVGVACPHVRIRDVGAYRDAAWIGVLDDRGGGLGEVEHDPRGGIQVEQRMWFNEANTSTWYLVPGLLALVMTLIGAFLTSLLIAREWERGTLEALLVTPVRRTEVVIGKFLATATFGLSAAAMAIVGYVVGGAIVRAALHAQIAGQARVLLGR